MIAEADVCVPITAEIDVFYARHRAKQKAEAMGFRSSKVYRLATAVSELANNLHFHAHPGGTIRIVCLRDGQRVGIEIVSQDTGPGIENIELAMRDGYSTNRGLGSGLPGAQRLMDDFSIHSEVGVGTRIVARLWLP